MGQSTGKPENRQTLDSAKRLKVEAKKKLAASDAGFDEELLALTFVQ